MYGRFARLLSSRPKGRARNTYLHRVENLPAKAVDFDKLGWFGQGCVGGADHGCTKADRE